jgi:hypothetical protein
MSRRHQWRQWIAVALLVLPMGCNSGGSGAVAAAAINTTIAAAASGVSRSQGGCYAACPTGTTCDPNTGYCVTLPCRGRCKPHEQCVEDTFKSQCIAVSLPGQITVEPSKEAKTEP